MSAFPSFVLDRPSELCFHLKIVCNCDCGPTGQVINQQNLLGIPKDCCHNCLHFKTHNKFQMHFYFYTLKINNTTVFTICIKSKWWLESMVAGATLAILALARICALSFDESAQIGSFMRYLYTQAKISCDTQVVPTRHMDLKNIVTYFWDNHCSSYIYLYTNILC